MIRIVRGSKLLFVVIKLCVFIIAQGEKEYLSNYTNTKVSCQNRGGLFTQTQLKYIGLMNNTCDLGVNTGMLVEGESVWVQGQAQTGPYVALHTCMRFSNKDKNSFIRKRTFYENILYECSVFCDQVLHSTGFLGIYKDSCFCMSDSFRFPHTPECLENDFLDNHMGVIVFRLMGNLQFDAHSKCPNFNCLGVSYQERGKASYFNTKCMSTLLSICTQRVDSALSNECTPMLANGTFCVNNDKATFLEHYQYCWLYNGTLLPIDSGIPLSLNSSVMLGSFRAFKAIVDNGENEDNITLSCLSITKYNGTVYLETENCSNENAFICTNDIDDIYNLSRSETKDGLNTNMRHPFLIICLISVPIGIMLALLIVWSLYKRHFNNRSGTNNGPSLNDMYITAITDERLGNDETQVEDSTAYDEIVEVSTV